MSGGWPLVCGLGAATGALLMLAGIVDLRMPPIPAPLTDRWVRIRARVRPARVATALVAGAGIGWVAGWPVAGIATAAGVVVVPPMLRPAGTVELIAVREGLAEWTTRLASLLSAGAGGIEDAIARSARTAPAALAEPVAALATRARAQGMETALRRFADEVGDFNADAVVASLILRVTDGGRGLVEVLDGRTATLRQDVDARRAADADHAKPRTQMRIIILIVAVTMAVLLGFSHLMGAYNSPEGQLWLAVVAGIWGTAFWLTGWLTRAPRPIRFLIDPHPRQGER